MDTNGGARRHPDKRKQASVSPTKASPDQKKQRPTGDDTEGEASPSREVGGDEARSTELQIPGRTAPRTGLTSLPGPQRALGDLSNFFKRIFRPSITEFHGQIGPATEKTIKNQGMKLEKAEDAMCELICELIDIIENYISLPAEEQAAAAIRERIRRVIWRASKIQQDQLLKPIMVLESAKKKTTTKGMKNAIDKLGETGRELGYRITYLSERIHADIIEKNSEHRGSPKTMRIKEALWELDMQFSNSVKPAIAEITTDLHTNTSRDVKEVIVGLKDIGQELGDAINRLKARPISSEEGSGFQDVAFELQTIHYDSLKEAVSKIKQGTKKRNTRIELKEYAGRLEEESGKLRKHIKKLNRSIDENDSRCASPTATHYARENPTPPQAQRAEASSLPEETGETDGITEPGEVVDPLETPSRPVEPPQRRRSLPEGKKSNNEHRGPAEGITAKDLREGLQKMRISLEIHITERLSEMEQNIGKLLAKEIDRPCKHTKVAGQSREKKQPRENREVTLKKMIITELDGAISANQIKEAVIKRTNQDTRYSVRVESPKPSNIRQGSSSAVYYVDDQTATTLMRDGVIDIKGRPHKTYEFVTLPCCLNCQKIRGHKTKDCHEPKQTEKICHRCAEKGHCVSQCTAPGPACYNCNDSGHPANSTNCPIYKMNLMEYLKQRSSNQ